MTNTDYSMKIEDLFDSLKTTKNGLSTEEASARLKKYGPNEIEDAKKESLVIKYLKQFKGTMVIILLIASAISIYPLGHINDAAVILLAVLINTIMGFRQEYKAEKAMDALKKLTVYKATVLRDGEEKEILATEIVPGDILFVIEGTKVPADGRVLSEIELEADESILTGESLPTVKDVAELPLDAPIAARKNMVFTGTIITHGKAEIVVTGTGMNTEIGKIATMIREAVKGETPLQKKIDQLSKHIAVFALIVCVVLFSFEILRNILMAVGVTRELIYSAFLTTVSLAVAIVPEGLPVVLVVTLAIGMQIMAKRHALVRKIVCTETLGSTTVICSDKTGTLTKNEMTVQEVHTSDGVFSVGGEGYKPTGMILKDGKQFKHGDDKNLDLLLMCAALCNDAHLVEKDGSTWQVLGDPMEGSLLTLGAKGGMKLKSILNEHPRTDEILFEANRRMMTTVHYSPNGKIAFSKGAPEVILSKCAKVYNNGVVKKIDERMREEILKKNKEMASRAYRILAFAYKELPDTTRERGDIEKELTFIGLVGIIDPPREEVAEAIRKCRSAGIKVKMVTGDQKETAVAIAKRVGLTSSEPTVLTGDEIDKMTDEEFKEKVGTTTIFARVSPEHKLKIVKALKGMGETVAVTGDGVNDAPALKSADIGIAMGVSGTDVAREASDMILLDDNFATIVSAVEEGRRIFDNIRRFIQYQLSTNTSAILLIFAGLLIGLPLPLLPTQILWVNIMMDGPPAVALGVEPATGDVMDKPPRKREEKILSMNIFCRILILGVIMGVGALILYSYYNPGSSPANLEKARTMTFTTFVLFQLVDVFNCRSLRDSVFKIGLFSNKPIILAIMAAFLLQVMVVHVPIFQPYFYTVPLSIYEWLLALIMASSVFIIEEARKMLFKRYNIWQE